MRWLLVVDFPDERLGLDHMHVLFTSRFAATTVLDGLILRLGERRADVIEVGQKPVCPWCNAKLME